MALRINANNPAGIKPVVSNNPNLIPKSGTCATNSGNAYNPIPKDKDLRRSILSNLKPDIWESLDHKFYNCSDNIVFLIIEFIKENSNHFD